MAHHRVDLDVGLGADRVDRAVARRHRRERRLLRAQPQLVAPVDALLVGAAVGDEAHLAARVADLRVGERARRAARARPAPSSRWRPRTPAARRAAARTAASWARTLPPRGSSSTWSAPAARARSAVRSAPGLGAAVDGDDHLEARRAASRARARWRPWPRSPPPRGRRRRSATRAAARRRPGGDPVARAAQAPQQGQERPVERLGPHEQRGGEPEHGDGGSTARDAGRRHTAEGVLRHPDPPLTRRRDHAAREAGGGRRRADRRLPGPRDPALDARPGPLPPRGRAGLDRGLGARARRRARRSTGSRSTATTTCSRASRSMDIDRGRGHGRDRLLGRGARRAAAGSRPARCASWPTGRASELGLRTLEIMVHEDNARLAGRRARRRLRRDRRAPGAAARGPAPGRYVVFTSAGVASCFPR